MNEYKPPAQRGPKVGIVGSGVVGLNTAIEALKQGFDVTMYEAVPFNPQIIRNPEILKAARPSEVAGAQWLPIPESERSEEIAWIEQSLDTYIQREAVSRYQAGMARRNNVELTKVEDRLPQSFIDLATPLGPVEEFQGIPENPRQLAWGYDFTTFQFDSPTLLSAMQEEFKELGGKLIIRKIQNENEFYDLPEDVLINCMGLEARDIFKNSNLGLEGMKGHMMLYTNPGIDRIVSAEDFILIPRSKDRLIVGCLYLNEGDYTTLEPTLEEQQQLLAGLEEVMGIDIKGFEALKKKFAEAQLLGAMTSLRPIRKAGVLVTAQAEGSKTVIHHVGHGGTGWTFAPGSAKTAVGLIKDI